MTARWTLLTLALGLLAAPATAETFRSAQATFELERWVAGLERPWGIAFLPDGDALVTERPGRLRLVEDGVLVAEPVAGLPAEITARGQGGLLDVVLDPDFAANGRVYLAYSAGEGDGAMTTRVVRGRLEDRALVDVEVLFTGAPWSSGGRHFGSRLAFDRAGFLYVTMGDRGDDDRAQNLGDHAGSIMRLLPDGGVPADNPFVGTPGAAPEIFTYGNRNPQGLAMHPATGRMWAHEHGPRGGDEINVLEAGTNYGWPVITHGIGYSYLPIGEGTHKEGMAQPIHYWDPSIAPSGMAFYTGDAFPDWRGDLFVGALRDKMLVRLELDGERVVEEERLLENEIGRIRDVRQGPDGHLFLLTDERNGGVWRLSPAS
jgi:glucose/arabinose dehydrogenase